MNNKTLFGAIAIIVIAGGAFLLQPNSPEVSDSPTPSTAVSNPPTSVSVASAEVLAESSDFTYETFTQERFDELRGSEAFVVFVHSRSCGTCAKKNKTIIDDVASFPNGTILKMEYDEAPQAFLEEHGVTKYDTFVIFNQDGSAETKKGASIDEVKESLI